MPHFSFAKDVSDNLAKFSDARAKNKSLVLRQAFELMVSCEHPDAGKQAAIKTVLDRYFSLPKNIPHFSFYTFLYMLSINYPDEDSKEFWGEQVYLSDHPRSHTDLKFQIDDEIKRILNIQKKK